MLFTLGHSPFECDFNALLRMTSPGDAIVLLQDGVTAALENCAALDILLAAPVSIFVLQDDVDARGLGGRISLRVRRASYTDFVRLVEKHATQIAW